MRFVRYTSQDGASYLDDWEEHIFIELEGRMSTGRIGTHAPRDYYSHTYHYIPDTWVLLQLGRSEIEEGVLP